MIGTVGLAATRTGGQRVSTRSPKQRRPGRRFSDSEIGSLGIRTMWNRRTGPWLPRRPASPPLPAAPLRRGERTFKLSASESQRALEVRRLRA
jgi:hypothetical protein